MFDVSSSLSSLAGKVTDAVSSKISSGGFKFNSKSIGIGNTGFNFGVSSSGKGLSLSIGKDKKEGRRGSGHDVPLLSGKSPTKYHSEYLKKLTDPGGSSGLTVSYKEPVDPVLLAQKEYGLLKYIYRQLFSEYVPDISGYTLLFMIPPDLSGYVNDKNSGVAAKFSNYLQNDNETGFVGWASKMVPFLATQYSAPQIQMNSSTLTSTSGSQQYASELQITDNMSVTFMETNDLDVYSFHRTWLNYIFEILEGNILPGDDYGNLGVEGGNYIKNRTIDYAASFYFVKFRPDMETITYIGKAIGCFPRELPSNELIGNRGTNELTTLTFNYSLSDFREVTYRESSSPMDEHWLVQEFGNFVAKYDQLATVDPQVPTLGEAVGETFGEALGETIVSSLGKTVGSSLGGAVGGAVGSSIGSKSAGKYGGKIGKILGGKLPF